MPTYEFTCEKCKTEKGIFCLYSEIPKSCDKCGATDPDFHQIYGCGIAIVYGNPTTFGQIAEANEKRLGKEQYQKIIDDEREIIKRNKPELPWWRSGKVEGTERMEKPLNLDTIADPQKYIDTGEKN